MKWKGCEKKRSCRYLTYSPGSCLKELAKNTVNFRLAFPPLPPGQGESHGPPLCQTLVIFFRSYRHTNPVNHKLHVLYLLTLILLKWRIWWAPNNASKWQMGFNSAFKGTSFSRHRNLVAVMTRLVIRQFRNRGSIPSKDKGFSRLHSVQTSFGAHRASIQRVPWANRPEHEADRPSKVKNILTLSCAFMTWC